MAPAVPKVDCDQVHATMMVSDILTAVEFYTKKLGFRLGFTWGDPPTFAGVLLDRVQIFLAQGTPNPKGGSVQFDVGDADELYEFHRANGVEIVEPIEDREYGMRDYMIRDLYGHYLGFGHPLFTLGPKVKIERVDVRYAWKNGWPLCCKTWPNISA